MCKSERLNKINYTLYKLFPFGYNVLSGVVAFLLFFYFVVGLNELE